MDLSHLINLGAQVFVAYLVCAHFKHSADASNQTKHAVNRGNDLINCSLNTLNNSFDKRIEGVDRNARHFYRLLRKKDEQLRRARRCASGLRHKIQHLTLRNRGLAKRNGRLRRYLKRQVDVVQLQCPQTYAVKTDAADQLTGVEELGGRMTQERSLSSRTSDLAEENAGTETDRETLSDDILIDIRNNLQERGNAQQVLQGCLESTQERLQWSQTRTVKLDELVELGRRALSHFRDITNFEGLRREHDTIVWHRASLCQELGLILTVLSTTAFRTNNSTLDVIRGTELDRLSEASRNVICNLDARFLQAVMNSHRKKDQDTALMLHERESEVARVRKERDAARSEVRTTEERLRIHSEEKMKLGRRMTELYNKETEYRRTIESLQKQKAGQNTTQPITASPPCTPNSTAGTSFHRKYPSLPIRVDPAMLPTPPESPYSSSTNSSKPNGQPIPNTPSRDPSRVLHRRSWAFQPTPSPLGPGDAVNPSVVSTSSPLGAAIEDWRWHDSSRDGQ